MLQTPAQAVDTTLQRGSTLAQDCGISLGDGCAERLGEWRQKPALQLIFQEG
jgi:hypothetical protein